MSAYEKMTAEQRQVWDLRQSGMTYREIAERIGTNENTVKLRLHRAKKWVALDPVIADRLHKRGFKDLGNLHSGWVIDKDKNGAGESLYFYIGPDQEEKISFADAVTEALQNIPQMPPLEKPEKIHNGNANFVAAADFHIGGDYGDPHYIAELEQAIDKLVSKLPPAEKAFLVELGDLLDANDHKGVTPASGNPCDVKRDNMWSTLMSAIRLFQRLIRRLAETHHSVEVHFCEGNHDRTAYMAVMIALAHHFEKAQNIEIVNCDDEYRVIPWGQCAVFPHHGDTLRPRDLKDVFADQFPDEWAAATAERQIWTGHYHVHKAEALPGVLHRQFGSPHGSNKWARSKGWFPKAYLSAVTLHKKEGETDSSRVNIKRKTLSEKKSK
jgi:hypothetical protein